jgi:predicted ChrR family anti-sigma factor
VREQASLYTLGLMEHEQARDFARHLSACATCREEVTAFEETAAQLPFALAETSPAPSLRTRLLNRIADKDVAASALAVPLKAPIPDLPAGMHVVMGGAGEWVETPLPGVRYKDLYESKDAHMATRLVQLDAGAGYPAHKHAAAEQCWVLSGDLHFGQAVFHGGDFLVAPEDSLHPPSFSENGCLLLIVASVHDEVIM